MSARACAVCASRPVLARRDGIVPCCWLRRLARWCVVFARRALLCLRGCPPAPAPLLVGCGGEESILSLWPFASLSRCCWWRRPRSVRSLGVCALRLLRWLVAEGGELISLFFSRWLRPRCGRRVVLGRCYLSVFCLLCAGAGVWSASRERLSPLFLAVRRSGAGPQRARRCVVGLRARFRETVSRPRVVSALPSCRGRAGCGVGETESVLSLLWRPRVGSAVAPGMGVVLVRG